MDSRRRNWFWWERRRGKRKRRGPEPWEKERTPDWAFFLQIDVEDELNEDLGFYENYIIIISL